MAVNLNSAKLVIKSQKTTNIRFLGESFSKRDNIVLDMGKQGLSDIQHLMKEIVIHDTDIEIKKGNDPTRLVVDNKETTNLKYARRYVEVTFGNKLDLLLIKSIQRELMSAIRQYAVKPADAALGSMVHWTWAFARKPGQVAQPVNINDVKSLPIGSYLILKPTSNMVGLADMFAARKDAGWSPGKWWNKGRSGGRGFMSKGINKLKRTRLMKNYTIHVVFTDRFKVPSEKYSHGTPVVVLRAKRSRYSRVRIKR